MRIICILFIKEKSERLEGKNFLPLNGKPLFLHIIDTLISIEEIDKIVLNTDSKYLIDYFDNHKKVIISERNERLKKITTNEANELISYEIDKHDADLFINTHTTNPLLRKETIQDAIKAFKNREDGIDSLFSVNEFNTRFYSKDLSPINHDINVVKKTQNTSKIYEENSCIYIFTKDSFKASGGRRIGLNPMIYVSPKIESFDIDEKDDFRLVESIQIND